MGVSRDRADRAALIPRLESLQQRLAGHRGVRHVVLGATDLAGSWTWTSASGTADPDGRTMETDTPWLMASITKLYVASVVLRLHEQGRISLDAPIATYLPNDLVGRLHVLRGVDHTPEITVTHLLGHLSGLPDALDGRPEGERSLIEQVIADGDRSWSHADVIAIARDRLQPLFPPSDPADPKARIRYSDTNFVLLMAIAEAVSGESMARLYQDHLFRPLGLTQTWLPGEEAPATLADPAIFWTGDAPFLDRPQALASALDLYTTVGDLLRFGEALFAGTVFADQHTGELMWRRFRRFGFPRGMAALRAPSWPIEYGLGMMRFALPRMLAGGRRLPAVMGHTGSTGSWLWWVPDLDLILAGTVDQATAAAVPFRQVPGALAGHRT